jgi:hypothetical protein
MATMYTCIVHGRHGHARRSKDRVLVKFGKKRWEGEVCSAYFGEECLAQQEEGGEETRGRRNAFAVLAVPYFMRHQFLNFSKNELYILGLCLSAFEFLLLLCAPL